MMVWIGASVLGVFFSVVSVLLVVAPGVRKFCCGAVCGLGAAGVLLFLFQPYTTPEQTRESRVSTLARGTGTETAVTWVPRPGRPGIPGAPPAPERSEAVSTSEEAAQAVQRFRTAQDVRQASE